MTTLALAGLVSPLWGATSADDADFSGYRIPTQDWFGWRGTVNGQFVSALIDADARSRQRQGYGTAAVGLRGGHDSEPWQHEWSLDARGSGEGSTSRVDQEFAAPSITQRMASASDQRQAAADWHAGGGMRWYPGRGALGTQARADVTGDHRRRWDDHSANSEGVALGIPIASEQNGDSHTRLNAYLVTFDVEEGLGRVRDASGVYDAWVLERRLQADGVLARPLSGPARARLAELFSVRYGYGMVHDRPDKAFWDEVEKLAREDGALTEAGFTAYSALHAVDPILQPARGAIRRLIGSFVGPVLRGSYRYDVIANDNSLVQRDYVADTLANETRSSFSDTRDREVSRVSGGASAEWHHPFGVRWQLDADGIALGEVRGIDRYSLVQSSGSIVYRLGERWIADARLDQLREVANDASPADRWQVVLTGAMRYYLEDRWSVGLQLGDAQGRDAAPIVGSPNYWRNRFLTLGLSYGAARFDAPGLIAPVRPLPRTGL